MSTTYPRVRFQMLSGAICLVGMGLLFLAILRATGGPFIYTLDDPYIHLSLAENLLRGHYGVNATEFASPSSSILYPFLLALTLALGLGDSAPLFLNAIGATGTAWVLSGLFWDALNKSENGHTSVIAILAIPFLLISINGFALAFTGMEHTLHVFASVAIIAGLTQVDRKTSPPIYLLMAIIAAPLLRFEGFALSGGALLALLYWGYWMRAVVTGALLFAILAGYIAFMWSVGLPLVPSSVLVKMDPSSATSTSLTGGSAGGGLNRQAIVLALGVGLLVIGAVFAKGRPKARIIAIVAILAAVAHLLVGRWNWFSRYEIYIIATTLAALFVVWQPQLSAASRRVTTPALSLFAFPAIGLTYLYVILLSPPAAQNIHDQQFQMHRFATDYFPETVAVTDLGWVTYRNEAYVLDLWGLGSETARQLFRAEGRNPDTVRRLTTAKNVTFAKLYEEVFYDGLPPEWCRIAQLETVQTTSTFATVEFFLLDPVRENEMRTALADFAATIPATATLAQFDCNAATSN